MPFVIGFGIGLVIIVPMVIIFISLGLLYQGYLWYTHWVFLIHWWEPLLVIMGLYFLMMYLVSIKEEYNEDITQIHLFISLGLLGSLYLGAWMSHWKWLFMLLYEPIGAIIDVAFAFIVVACVLAELYDMIPKKKREKKAKIVAKDAPLYREARLGHIVENSWPKMKTK